MLLSFSLEGCDQFFDTVISRHNWLWLHDGHNLVVPPENNTFWKIYRFWKLLLPSHTFASKGSCGSGVTASCPLTRRLVVRAPSHPFRVPKCPWARYLDPNCPWWLCWHCMNLSMNEWMAKHFSELCVYYFHVCAVCSCGRYSLFVIYWMQVQLFLHFKHLFLSAWWVTFEARRYLLNSSFRDCRFIHTIS